MTLRKKLSVVVRKCEKKIAVVKKRGTYKLLIQKNKKPATTVKAEADVEVVHMHKELTKCWTFWCRNKWNARIRQWFAAHKAELKAAVGAARRAHSKVEVRVRLFLRKLKARFNACKNKKCRDKCIAMIHVLKLKSKKLHSKWLSLWFKRNARWIKTNVSVSVQVSSSAVSSLSVKIDASIRKLKAKYTRKLTKVVRRLTKCNVRIAKLKAKRSNKSTCNRRCRQRCARKLRRQRRYK